MPLESYLSTRRLKPREWRQALEMRPLLGLGTAALLGVASGGAWAHRLSNGDLTELARHDSRLWMPLWAALVLALVFGVVGRPKSVLARIALLGIGIWGAFAVYAAHRVVPPIDDVSRLVSRLASQPLAREASFQSLRDGPLEAPVVELQGHVAEFPRRGEFFVQFPLETTNLESFAGRVWVRAPFDAPVRAGDEIVFQAQLRPLERATNPGERETMWFPIGAGCWCEAVKVKNLRVIRRAPSNSLVGRVDSVRRAILARYEAMFRARGLESRPFPASTAQLLTAMVFGEGGLVTPLPRRVRDDFRVAGLSHVLVASGAQVSFLVVGILLAARTLRLRGVVLLLFLVPPLVFYALVAGGAPSIWRATLIGVLAALALGCGRRTDALSLWSAALIGLLALDPALAWSLSWQLTFAATWGLIVLAPALERAMLQLGDGLVARVFRPLAALSLGAQWATLPLSLFHFGTLSTASLGANFLAVPLAAIMLFCGALGLFLPILEPLLYGMTRVMVNLSHGAARLPGAGWQGLSLPLVWTWACYVALAISAVAVLAWPDDWREVAAQARHAWTHRRAEWNNRWRERGRRDLNSIAALLLVSGLALAAWNFWPRAERMRLVMLDVGQGESLILISPRGRAVLIDGGSLDERSDVGRDLIVPALSALGISRLEAVFLTHADSDHYNALSSVLREVPVGALVDGAAVGETALDQAPEYLAVRREASRQNVPVVAPRAGMLWQFDGMTIRVLAPSAPLFDDKNDDALVLRAEFGQSSILLAADVEREGEARLVARGLQPTTILKVAHHGSNTSSTDALLEATQPLIALVSCGRFNRFGHPHPAAIERLKKSGARVFRTDLDGALEASCDKDSCLVRPTRE